MQKILIPVDGTENALHAVRHAARYTPSMPIEVHLLNVQPVFPRHVSWFIPKRVRNQVRRERGNQAIAEARDLLARLGIPACAHIAIGDKAAAIAATAARTGCDRIVMATARRNTLTRLFDVSLTKRVINRASVPVEVVPGNRVPAVERIGVPVGLGTALALAVASTIE